LISSDRRILARRLLKWWLSLRREERAEFLTGWLVELAELLRVLDLSFLVVVVVLLWVDDLGGSSEFVLAMRNSDE